MIELTFLEEMFVMRNVTKLFVILIFCFQGMFAGPLHKAVEDGKIEEVKKLLKIHDVNGFDKDGNIPLIVAIVRDFDPTDKGYREMIKLLVSSGADVNKENRNGYTPLYGAVFYSDTSLALFLIKNGAEIDKVVRSDYVLRQAVEKQDVEMVKLLVDKGADVGKGADTVRGSAFHEAAKKGYAKILQILLGAKVGAEGAIDAMDYSGFTPLYYALENGHEKIVKILVEKKVKTTKLFLSFVRDGDYEKVRLLVSAGVDANKGDKSGTRPLHSATLAGRLKIVEFLIEKGKAKVDIKNNNDQTPLYIATREGYVDIVFTLILKGANRETKFDGKTLLEVADQWMEKTKRRPKKEKFKVVKKLLKMDKKKLEKKELDPITAEQVHPVMMSNFGLKCRHRISFKTFEKMLKFKEEPAGTARPKLKRGEALQDYPQMIINKKRYAEVIDSWWRLDPGGYYYIPMPRCPFDRNLYPREYYTDKVEEYSPGLLIEAVKSRDRYRLRRLLAVSSKSEINLPDKSGNMPIHYAVNDSIEIVRALCLSGADINAKNKKGNTWLHIASRKPFQYVILSKIISLGADVRVRNNAGNTPLHTAAFFGRYGVVSFLRANGAEVDAANKKGQTPLYLAVRKGNDKVVGVLLKYKANKEIKFNDKSLLQITEELIRKTKLGPKKESYKKIKKLLKKL